MSTPNGSLFSATPRNSKRPSATASLVRVALRVRPFLPSEKHEETKNSLIPCVSLIERDDKNGGEVTVLLKDQWSSRNERYNLDSFFNQADNVKQIFFSEVGAMIPGVFQGSNASIFAYGATGSGKTYTMQGREGEPGLIQLSMKEIFDLRKEFHCSVEISYYEVYMDRCYDLLGPKGMEIMALDDKDGKVQLKGLARVPVNSMDDFEKVFSTGNQRRKVGSTGLNDASSRSHAIISIAVSKEAIKGKINLIDLAGNEDNRRSLNQGIHLQEINKINQSLFALSNVIHALNNNKSRIPYRDSKLTRLLQDSLGGTSRALMIACLNPASYQEAVRTVNLAARTRKIVNYVCSDTRKEESPKEMVDMEAKLRAWQESKGKTKSSQRMNWPSYSSSPFVAKALHSTNSQGISCKKGRKLFGSEAAKLNIKEVEEDNISISLSSSTVMSPPIVERDGDDKTSQFDGEDQFGQFTFSSNLMVSADNKNKELQNDPFYQTSGGEGKRSSLEILPSGCKFLDLQRCMRIALSPIQDNSTPEKPILATNFNNLFNSTSPKIFESLNVDKEQQALGTPLDKFNISSSHLKDSLVQEYISFLNAASRKELLQLKGIGHKRAEYILQLRESTPEPIKSLSDLEKIGLSSKQVHGLFVRAARGIFT